MIKFNFEEQFGKDKNWSDDLLPADFTDTLKSFYPLFYKTGSDTPDYDAIREELKKLCSIKQSTEKRPKQARELIKNLFRIPYKCINDTECKQSVVLNTLKDSFGHRIIAHGVEEAKGGLSNILLMLVSNKVLAVGSNWGAFLDGPPNASPLCHGPYYLIYSTQDQSPLSNPSFSSIEYILVPFPQHIELLREKVESMAAVNLVTKREQKVFFDRLIDYQGFLNLLNNPELEQEPDQDLNEKKKRKRKTADTYAADEAVLFLKDFNPNLRNQPVLPLEDTHRASKRIRRKMA